MPRSPARRMPPSPVPRNAPRLGASVTLARRSVDVFSRYDGLVGAGYSVNGGSAAVRVTFRDTAPLAGLRPGPWQEALPSPPLSGAEPLDPAA